MILIDLTQMLIGVSPGMFANNGIQVPAPMEIDARGGMFACHVLKQVRWGNLTSHLPTQAEVGQKSHGFSSRGSSCHSSSGKGVSWTTEDYIKAHHAVRQSGMFNFEGCKIPIPTAIRVDRIESALGSEATPKEQKVLSLLRYGMPLNCDPGFGVQKPHKNHFSAISYEKAMEDFLESSVQTQAMLGPFEDAPISELCYSPLMSVPKEDTNRRVIVDFSYPAGRSVNDGISKVSYLDLQIEFCLPSVQSMINRLNDLGPGCLLYKRDLKGAFRQFNIDPGDYCLTGVFWKGKAYIDTRLAMGLRSSAYCCQSVTEMLAKIAGRRAHVLVYLDDFGGAEPAERALDSFNHLGWLLDYCGLEESTEKAVAPATEMNWLGVRFDTVEWSMALKPGKLQELLEWLPKLLKHTRVRKVLLQKVLGSLVWASAVIRAGVVFFNRLLGLLRKLKRPSHSIHFSQEAKKDVLWWLDTLRAHKGKCAIPPSVWTPLVSFATDASLEGFGMVWGTRALAGLFPIEFEDMDINKKEMLSVMAAIKHWFSDLENLKVTIFVDNQVCVALLNYGITRSPFLASCLREIQSYLARYSIELRAEYIPSKENCLADLCS